MTANTPAALIAATTKLQSDAADPLASVWVSANAGTGKTHVLTQRVLRLLLTGTAPERILCLTYTKAAAAEMSKRVFDTLSVWVGLDDARLTQTLEKLLGTQPATRELALARTLFTRAIETPGGFKVQTIHAFCERLLQRFPLEAGVSPGFQILDDHTGRSLIRDAIDATLMEATSDRTSPLGAALTTAVRYAADDAFDAVLADAIRSRALLASLIRAGDISASGDPFEAAQLRLRAHLDVRKHATPDTIRSEMAAVLEDATLMRLADALAAGSKSDITLAPSLTTARGSSGMARIEALASYFLTKERGLRSRLMTQGVSAEHPDLDLKANSAQARFHALDNELRAIDVVDATLALYRLADAVLTRYQATKAARAALDFDDLIVKTSSLLHQPDGAAWVLYKLDGGLDHILVDEAQDTAPTQWSVIEKIAAEFFADSGAGSKARTRTVFAVGDEKQSIYSFQGAEPKMFAATGARFKEHAERTGQTWRATALTLSFRTVEPILSVVDQVFANPDVTPGLAIGNAAAIRHAVKRVGQGGLVEIWPTELPDEKESSPAWSPLEETTSPSPVSRLADRIARTIKGWLDSGERLASQNRPIRAGDILILVRKREPFAPAIVSALKSLKVPVAGADRIVLTRQIGVQDLVALGDFLTLPEDDLSLATILKCPLFGLDDGDLLTLAQGRKDTFWKNLLDQSANPRFAIACEQLKRWRKEADFLPPFEFFASVLDGDNGRLKLLERLGPEAADGIDEFLNLALTYDDQYPPSLTGFLGWVRADERQIKRDMDQGRDEVRVLTVHGSKGLEAPIVFLPDTCQASSGRVSNGLLALPGSSPEGHPDLAVWPVKGASGLPAIADARAGIKSRESQELDRLLYVALTRPRDRLYIAGFQSRAKLPPGCWYDVITGALSGRLARIDLPGGTTVQRLVTPQSAEPDARGDHAASAGVAAPHPAWMTTAVPREPAPAIPLAPSRLAPYDFDEQGEPKPFAPIPAASGSASTQPFFASPQRNAGDHRFLRGTLTHDLLEHLPQLPRDAWPEAAAGFLAERGGELTAHTRRSIVTETLSVLNDPVFSALFGPMSQAEVPIVAELPNPSGKGAPLKIYGQIDRLVEQGREMLIVDYKTNRPPPLTVAEVAETYLVQLAAYRRALAAIFPQYTVRAALLWTQTPSLMEIPAATLDAYGSQLWELGTPKLDVTGLST